MEFPRPAKLEAVQLDSFVDAIPGSIAVITNTGQILQTNRHWDSFARENSPQSFDYLDSNYLDVCDEAKGEDAADAAIVAEAIREIANGDRKDASLVYPCHSPSEKRWFRVCLCPIDQEHILVMHTDVTTEYLTREQLEEHRFKLHTITGSQSECVKTLARDGTILEMNEGGLKILGARHPKEVLGQSVLEFIDLEDHTEFMAFFKKVLRGKAGSIEFRLVGIHGRLIWVRSVCSPMRGSSGVVETVLSITQDISLEKKTIEQARAMRERETLLSNASQLAKMGTWAYDVHSQRLVWSPETCELFGFELDEFDGKLDTFRRMILPEDQFELDRAIELADASKDGVIHAHYRIRLPNGEVRSMYE